MRNTSPLTMKSPERWVDILTIDNYNRVSVSAHLAKRYKNKIIALRISKIFKIGLREACAKVASKYKSNAAANTYKHLCCYFGICADMEIFWRNYKFKKKPYINKIYVLKIKHLLDDARDEKIKKITETNLKTYDSNKDEIVGRIKATKKRKWGDENYNNSGKAAKTCVERYGVYNPSKLEWVRKKISEKAKDPEICKKKHASMVKNSLEKTGRLYPWHLHLKNYENFNREFIIKNFTKGGKICKQAMKDYFGYKSDSPLNCKILGLGEFEVYRGFGYSESKFIDDIEKYIPGVERQAKIDRGKSHHYKVDGLYRKAGIIFEFLGDYWHGNPKKYKNCDDWHRGITYGDIYAKTVERFEILKSLGYEIFYIWESDYKSQGLKALKKFTKGCEL